MMRFEDAKRFVLDNDDFLVVSHINPDGDAASSTCGVGWLLNQLGKQYVMVNVDPLPERFRYLPGFSQVQQLSALESKRIFSRVIVVDCADPHRYGDLSPYVTEDSQFLNIDHHASNKHYGSVALIDAEAAATAQIVFALINYMGIELDDRVAGCLYTGLITDTGGFRYQNTTPEVMEIASKLLSYGVNPTDIARTALERITHSHVQILQKALSTLTLNAHKNVAWMVTSSDDLTTTGATADDLDGIVRFPVNLEGVEVGMLFKQLEPNLYKISFRSNDYVDVSAVAGEFGGGGHIRAAGATVHGELHSIIRDVLRTVESNLR